MIVVAAHIATGEEISTEGFNAVEAKSYLQRQGFNMMTSLGVAESSR